MFLFCFLIGISLIEALHENLTAVHYSIVSPGIDDQINPGECFNDVTEREQN